MTVPVSVRFEVIKRDRYTCSYCGKHPPDVLLEVDHIVPRAAGGSDDIANLTTACTDCNRGKGSRLLEEGTGPAVNPSALAEMQERIDQAKAYMEMLGAIEQITAEQVWRVNDAWAKAYNAERIETEDSVKYRLAQGNWPEEPSIKRFIKKLGLEQVLDAVDITAAKFRHPTMETVRYFYGVCHHAIRDAREPLSPQTSTDADNDGFFDAGWKGGVSSEHYRLGQILKHWADEGYPSLDDAVLALWPED